MTFDPHWPARPGIYGWPSVCLPRCWRSSWGRGEHRCHTADSGAVEGRQVKAQVNYRYRQVQEREGGKGDVRRGKRWKGKRWGKMKRRWGKGRERVRWKGRVEERKKKMEGKEKRWGKVVRRWGKGREGVWKREGREIRVWKEKVKEGMRWNMDRRERRSRGMEGKEGLKKGGGKRRSVDRRDEKRWGKTEGMKELWRSEGREGGGKERSLAKWREGKRKARWTERKRKKRMRNVGGKERGKQRKGEGRYNCWGKVEGREIKGMWKRKRVWECEETIKLQVLREDKWIC